MSQIFHFFTNIVLMLIAFFVCISVASAVQKKADADAFKADVVAEIENCNFNENVRAACVQEASEAGYVLEIVPCSYDADFDVQLAKVTLTYSYEVPLLGIKRDKTLRGIAR